MNLQGSDASFAYGRADTFDSRLNAVEKLSHITCCMLKWWQSLPIIIALTKRDNFIANSLHIFSVLEERTASRSSRSSRKHRSYPSSCDEVYYENTYNFQQWKLLTFCSPKQQRLTESLNLSTSAGRLTVKNKLKSLKYRNQKHTAENMCFSVFILPIIEHVCVGVMFSSLSVGRRFVIISHINNGAVRHIEKHSNCMYVSQHTTHDWNMRRNLIFKDKQRVMYTGYGRLDRFPKNVYIYSLSKSENYQTSKHNL